MIARRTSSAKEEQSVFTACGIAAAAVNLPDFHEKLLDAVGSLVAHDLRSMMRYSRYSAPDFLDNNSYRPEFVAHYEAEFYRYDPYYRYWKETERPGVVPLTRVTNGKATRSRYVNVVLTEAGISDELSVFLPPVGGSSLALFLDRFDGYFAKPEIARLEMAYPLVAGLHQAHVSCLMSGACDPADGANAALPQGRPIRVLDRRGRARSSTTPPGSGWPGATGGTLPPPLPACRGQAAVMRCCAPVSCSIGPPCPRPSGWRPAGPSIRWRISRSPLPSRASPPCRAASPKPSASASKTSSS